MVKLRAFNNPVSQALHAQLVQRDELLRVERRSSISLCYLDFECERAEDVSDTLEMALAAAGCDQARVMHKPRLLSDNGPGHIAAGLTE